MKNLKHEKTTINKFSVKGVLSEDGRYITYYDNDKNEREITVETCLKPFWGEQIDFSVAVKSVEDLDEGEEE